MRNFAEGTKVTIHSLGSSAPGEYRGIIRGIAVQDPIECTTIWIVEMIDKWASDYPYSNCTVPTTCLCEGWKN